MVRMPRRACTNPRITCAVSPQGGEVRLNDAWTLRAGYAIGETPTTIATRTPRLPNEDRTWYSIGASWQYSERLALSFGYIRIEPDTPRLAIVTPPQEGGHCLSGTYDSSSTFTAFRPSTGSDAARAPGRT